MKQIIEGHINSNFIETMNQLKHKYSLEDILSSAFSIRELFKRNIFTDEQGIKLIKPKFPDKFNINSLVLGMTEQCNFRCGYCSYSGKYLGQRLHNALNIKLEHVFKSIDDIINLGSDELHVGFYGGEPSLQSKKIIKVSEYVKGKIENPTFSIITNGYDLSDEIINFIIDNNFTLVFSLDGDKETHDKMRVTRFGGLTHSKIMENIKKIKEKNTEYYFKKVGFNCVVTPLTNLIELEDYFSLDLFKENEVNFIPVYTYDHNINFKKGDKQIFEKEFEELKERYMATVISGRYGDRPKLIRTFYEKPLKQILQRKKGTNEQILNGACLPGIQKIFLNSRGDYQICEKASQSLYLGNVETGIEIDKCGEILENYYNFVKDSCEHCWSMRFCGMCQVSPLKNNQYDIDRLHENCSSMKNLINETLELYSTVLEKNPVAWDFLFKKDLEVKHGKT